MANNFGTLTPDIIALRTMDFLKKKFPLILDLATDFSELPIDFGETVRSRVVTIPEVQDYDTTNGYVASDATTVDVPVTINKHKHVSLSFNEQELSGTKRNLADEQMEAAAYALGHQMITDLFALVTKETFTNAPVIATVANTDRSVIGSLRQALTNAGAGFPRYGVVNPGVFDNLCNDARIVNANFGLTQPDYEMGSLQNIVGFQNIWEWADLPGNGENITGFFGSKQSLVIATRVPKDPATLIPGMPIPGEIKVVQDPDTGIGMMVRFFYNMQLGRLQMTLTWMYGVAEGVEGNGIVLATA